MLAKWVTHLKTKEEKEEFRKRLLNLNDIFEIQKSIIQKYIDSSVRKTKKSEFLESPNWAHARAFEDGRQAAYEDMLTLLTIKPKWPYDRPVNYI